MIVAVMVVVVMVVAVTGEVDGVVVFVVVDGDADTTVEVSRASFLVRVVSSTKIAWVLMGRVPVKLTATRGMTGSSVIVHSAVSTRVCRSFWNPGTSWDALISSVSRSGSGFGFGSGSGGGKTFTFDLLSGDHAHGICRQRSCGLLLVLLFLSSGDSDFAVDSNKFEVGCWFGDVSCGEDFLDGRLGRLERRREQRRLLLDL